MADPVTKALVAPLPIVEPAAWRAALEDAERVLAELAGPGAAVRRPATGCMRITDHAIRTALDPAGPATAWDSAFAWSARTARRSLGLAAVRALLSGESANPGDAVRARVAQASRLVRDGAPDAARAASLDRWLARLSPAGRAAAGAEAVTWATRLWCGLDWDAIGPPVVIGRDRWWDSPHSSLLSLRGRAEVHTTAADLVVLSGPRRDSVRAELALVMLVSALRARGNRTPGRVVGWWPESGHLVTLEPEPSALRSAAAAVARAAACWGRDRPARSAA